MPPRLLIITGTSGVGKSTMSAKLASGLGFGKTAATDTVREVLRTQFTNLELPELHRSSFEYSSDSAIDDWRETVEAVSIGVRAVIDRAKTRGSDLLLEGVHIIPSREEIDSWRESGGTAIGVVLYIAEEERHRSMIAKRENHNGKGADHYLDNIHRIREIQEEMVMTGSASDWLLVDPTRKNDSSELISNMLR